MATKRPKKSAPKTETPAAPTVAAFPPEHRPETHSFAYRDGAASMTCVCGAEQELRLVDGKAARMYRASTTAAWGRAIDVCPKYVAPVVSESQTSGPEESSLVSGLMAALEKEYPDAFAPEIVDGSDVEKTAAMVDLTAACSPVLPHRAPKDPLSGVGDALLPVECSPLDGDMYRVYFAEGPRDVSADQVKIMRARFLLRKGELSRVLITMNDQVRRQRLMELYQIHWVPPAGSPLAAMAQGRVRMISIPRDGDAPVDIMAVMKALSAPGGEIPTVCPTLPANESDANKATG